MLYFALDRAQLIQTYQHFTFVAQPYALQNPATVLLLPS